ncbi:MAG: EamA family transporter [Gammaproteobacteria bacterium]|nr:EamA family transporter [Gammaproteobacteria bacterium]
MGRGWGIAMAVLSALCYGAALPLSRLAYDHGANALTIMTLRYLAIVVLLGLWLHATGTRFRMAPRLMLACAAVGVCFVAISGGTLASVSFIPVNLTVVVFYTYPMMTLLVVSAIERRRPGTLELLAIVLALLGVGLAVQVSFETLNTAGVGFALLAAVGVAGSFLIASRTIAAAGTTRTTFYACAMALLGGATLTLAFDAVALPNSPFGVALIAVVIAVFATAVITMFVAVRLIGPVRLATFLCLEPVMAIFIAVLALDEHLKSGQWLGVGLVGLALLLASRRET